MTLDFKSALSLLCLVEYFLWMQKSRAPLNHTVWREGEATFVIGM